MFNLLSYSAARLARTSLLIGILALLSEMHGQTPLNPFPCPDANTLPRACRAATYQLTFDVTGGAPGTWSVSGGPSSVITNGAISWNIPSGAPSSYTLTVTASAGGPTATFTLPTVPSATLGCPMPGGTLAPKPCLHEVAFVLDRSGSMTLETPTRWGQLNTLLQGYLAQLTTVNTGAVDPLDANDRWSGVLFGDEVSRETEGHFLNIPASTDIIPSTLVANGMTPMGAGLQMALERCFQGLGVAGQGKNRMIMLLTDGDQNMDPLADETAPLSLRASGVGFPMIDKTPNPGPDILYPGLPANSSINLTTPAHQSVKVYAIGIGGVSTEAESTLTALATNSSGDVARSTDAARTSTLFNNAATQWLAASSPRLLDDRPGMAGSYQEPTVERFFVNDSVQSLTVKFFATESRFTSAMITVKKDGVPITPTQINYIGSHNILVLLDFQKNTAISSPAGLWEISIGDVNPTKYNMGAFVEDKMLHYDLTVAGGTSKLYAGDDLQVRCQITYRGAGMEGDTVTAYLLRPGDDLGDLMANAPTPKDLQPFDQNGSLSQAKFDFYSVDPQIRALMKDSTRIILLKNEGKGVYTGTFTGNEVTGIYQVFIRSTGYSPQSKRRQGWAMRGAFFDFSRPEDITLLREVVDLGLYKDGITLGGHHYAVRITPVNKFGKKIGPGQSRRIKITAQPGSVYNFTDNLDGSYGATVKAPEGSNPQIGVYVIDQQKPVQVFPAKNSSWSLSLHAGLSLPTAKLDSLYNPGAFVEADATYRISNQLDAEALLGYYGFGGGFNILGASVLAGYRLNLSTGLHLRPAIGGGYFKPKSESGTTGYTARLELVKELNSNLEGALHGAYFNLPGPNYSFWAAGLGIKYHF